MSEFVFPPTPARSLPIFGTSQLFPVHRIFCVGRNYAAHAVEMGHDPNRSQPFFFQKHIDCIIQPDENFPYPSHISNDVHHEIEHVIALSNGGKDITVDEAKTHIFGYALGIDFTLRDIQAQAKKEGRPWDVAKGFDHSAPLSAIRPATEIGHIEDAAISLTVNGTPRQSGNLNQMIWKTPEIIAYLSSLFELRAGDLIMTGTPAGVGPVEKGDHVTGHLEHVADIELRVF